MWEAFSNRTSDVASGQGLLARSLWMINRPLSVCLFGAKGKAGVQRRDNDSAQADVCLPRQETSQRSALPSGPAGAALQAASGPTLG